MAIHLEEKFMAQLDMHSSELIKVIRAKGGATRQKTTDIMDTLDKTEDIHIRRECVLKALIFFLGENADDLIKEYTDSDYAQRDLEQLTMAVFAIRREGEGLQEPPEDIGVVTEGVEGLHELTSVASACALLPGNWPIAADPVKCENPLERVSCYCFRHSVYPPPACQILISSKFEFRNVNREPKTGIWTDGICLAISAKSKSEVSQIAAASMASV
ncbi:hypothetical protein SRHO_G00146670 [Serrasalmus rhombeus]